MLSDDSDEPLILHCFADYGAESEILSDYSEVIRIGIDPHDTNDSEPIAADAHILDEKKDWDIPIKDDVTFDLGVFHPVCSKWASTTSISGDPDEHVNMIPSARSIAKRYCDFHIIENVPRAPLEDPVVLNGRMFGLPVEYERAFETNFKVPQPPRHKHFWGENGEEDTAETSSFFFTERTRRWWGSVKGVPARSYPKQHLAKNVIPGAYIHHLCRAWLKAYEDDTGIDYSDYDDKMDNRRREEANRSLSEFDPDSDEEPVAKEGSERFVQQSEED
jgi:hypothetical protein